MRDQPEPGTGEIDGSLSSPSGSTSGLSPEIPENVADVIQAAGRGSPITEDMSILRADYSAGQASLPGVREVADRCLP